MPVFKPQQFELVFVDGCHTYEAAASDLRHARELVDPGGVIVVHDWDRFEVTPACREFFNREPDRIVGSLASYESL
jgi:predicted O-methyltransferase YrrM